MRFYKKDMSIKIWDMINTPVYTFQNSRAYVSFRYAFRLSNSYRVVIYRQVQNSFVVMPRNGQSKSMKFLPFTFVPASYIYFLHFYFISKPYFYFCLFNFSKIAFFQVNQIEKNIRIF